MVTLIEVTKYKAIQSANLLLIKISLCNTLTIPIQYRILKIGTPINVLYA